MKETKHLLSTKTNTTRLIESMEQIDNKETTELIESELFNKELREAVDSGVSEYWFFDGKNEYPEKTFNSETSCLYVLEFIKKFFVNKKSSQ
jgi:hypothetical protein